MVDKYQGYAITDWTLTTTTDCVMWTRDYTHIQQNPYWGGPYNDSPKENSWDIIKTLLEENQRVKNKEEDKLMKVYEVIVVDAKECEVIKQQNVIAKDTETAMLEIDLAPETRKKVKKGEVKFIFNELGSFEKVERQVRVKEIVEE